MTARERILSYAEDADWAIASLVRVLTEAGISEAGVNVIAMAREQIRVWLPGVLEELDETSRRPNPARRPESRAPARTETARAATAGAR
jgi:hypothetical protein